MGFVSIESKFFEKENRHGTVQVYKVKKAGFFMCVITSTIISIAGISIASRALYCRNGCRLFYFWCTSNYRQIFRI